VARKTTGKKPSKSATARTSSKPTASRSAAAPRQPHKKDAPRRTASAAAASRPAKASSPPPASKSRVSGGQAQSGAKPAAAAKPSATQPEAATRAGRSSKTLTLGRGKKVRTVAEAASNINADAKGYVFINGRRVRMISTKNVVLSKKPRNNGAPEAAQPPDPISIKSIKTKLSRKELNHYRDLLLLKRRELVGDLHAMETEALRSGGGNLSHMPIHMADIGTDTYDQDFMLGLAANERDQLREIDAALQRIEDRSYGVCQLTGKPIPKARLDAKPWAKYTIEAARKMEGQWGR
jgi:DnaK suppressor protein